MSFIVIRTTYQFLYFMMYSSSGSRTKRDFTEYWDHSTTSYFLLLWEQLESFYEARWEIKIVTLAKGVLYDVCMIYILFKTFLIVSCVVWRPLFILSLLCKPLPSLYLEYEPLGAVPSQSIHYSSVRSHSRYHIPECTLSFPTAPICTVKWQNGHFTDNPPPPFTTLCRHETLTVTVWACMHLCVL